MDKTNKLEVFLAEKEKKKEEKKIVMFSDRVYKFDSAKDASDKTNISYTAIFDNINKNTKYAKSKSGLKVKFMKKLEYDKLHQSEIDSILAVIDGEKLVILNTGQEFSSAKEISNYLNTDSDNVYAHLKNKIKSCGYLNGERCVIKYKKDYIKLSKNEIKDLIKNANSKMNAKSFKLIKDNVVLFNTGELFNTISEVCNKYGFKYSNLHRALRKSKTHICEYENNIPLLWFYGEDYNNLTEEDMEYYNQVIKENTKQNIVLYNNGKIYTRDFILNEFNIGSSSLSGCLSGKSKSSGRYKGYPLVWMHEDKYNSLTEEGKEELNKYIKDNTTRYYFVNENKPFYNINQFSKDYNILSISIQKCLNKKQKSTRWKEGERAIFIYLDEFNNMTKEQREKYLAECEIEKHKKYSDNSAKPVKSYTEGIEFDSHYEAKNYYGIDGRAIFKSIKNNEWITDEYNKPLKFEDIEKEKGEE